MHMTVIMVGGIISLIITNNKHIIYPMHERDYLITLVSLCVCLWIDRLSNNYIRSSLPIFTQFYTTYGPEMCSDRRLLFLRHWDKPEVVVQFSRSTNSNFGSFSIMVAMFFHGLSQESKQSWN